MLNTKTMNIKIKLIIFILFLWNITVSHAQCGTGSIVTINNQEDLDAFGTSISGCTTYTGGIKLNGFTPDPGKSDITNLSPLSALQTITGVFWVLDTDVTSLAGLNNLTSVGGGFLVQNNYILTNIDALFNLTTISGYFLFSNNKILQKIDGLASLTTVNGNVNISYNNNLTSCCGIFPLVYSNGATGSIVFGPNNGAFNTAADVLNSGYISVNLNHCFTSLSDAISYASTNNGIVGTHLDVDNLNPITIPYNVTLRIYDGLFSNKSTISNNGVVSLNGGNFENAINGIYKGKGNFVGNFSNNGVVSPGN